MKFKCEYLGKAFIIYFYTTFQSHQRRIMGPAKKKQRLSDGSAVALNQDDEKTDAQPETSTPDKQTKHAKRSLFVRQLPANTTTESLTELFSNNYPVKHATAILDPATKECKGYGFVTFADEEDAVKAKKEFHGHLIDGKKLRVEVAEPRQRDGDIATTSKVKKEEEVQLPPKLIVRNLPWSIKGSEQLTKLFLSYGKVKQAYVPKKGPGLMAGFGFVIMRGRKNAEKAIEGVNGKVVDGRTLAVDWAVDKTAYEGLNEENGETPNGKAKPTDDEDDEDEDEDEDEDGGVDIGDDDEVEVDDDDDDDNDDAGLEDEGEGIDDEEGDEDAQANRAEDKSHTIFVRNLPFTCSDEDLEEHFSQFGSTRYARVVMDFNTERSRGTGFVCFYDKKDAETCVRGAPQRPLVTGQDNFKKGDKPALAAHSILQNDGADLTGQYTLDGRVLQVTAAVEKSQANRLAAEGTAQRSKRDNDKRRLYLLSEGTISSKSKLWDRLAPSEKAMREASAKQRKTLIESNPSLHLSLTRLSIRNIPRSVGAKELKALARDAIVGFASDVKNGVREKLSKEEIARGGDEMREAELARKRAGKGVVKQATVVFEGAGGTKMSEDTGAGRSRGYGFIEYHTHRNALMGLRWLNGHAIDYKVAEGQAASSREDVQDRKKRLIVEFAIENAQVVMRRKEKEDKARARSKDVKFDKADGKFAGRGGKDRDRKRKRGAEPPSVAKKAGDDEATAAAKKTDEEKLARRNQIIGRKRVKRAARKGGK
jgi:nucleolar protein 4